MLLSIPDHGRHLTYLQRLHGVVMGSAAVFVAMNARSKRGSVVFVVYAPCKRAGWCTWPVNREMACCSGPGIHCLQIAWRVGSVRGASIRNTITLRFLTKAARQIVFPAKIGTSGKFPPSIVERLAQRNWRAKPTARLFAPVSLAATLHHKWLTLSMLPAGWPTVAFECVGRPME